MSAELEPMVRRVATSIVERLRAQCPALRVEHFPDAPDRLPYNAAHQSALLFYKGSSFAGESFTRATDRTIEWWIYVCTRSLVDGSDAAYQIIDDVESALVDDDGSAGDIPKSWRPPQGGTAMQLVRNEFVEEDNGLWIYRVVVRHTLPRVARTRRPPTGSPPQTPTIETEVQQP